MCVCACACVFELVISIKVGKTLTQLGEHNDAECYHSHNQLMHGGPAP